MGQDLIWYYETKITKKKEQRFVVKLYILRDYVHCEHQGGLTGKVQDTGYPEVPTSKGLKKFFNPKPFWGYNAVFPQTPTHLLNEISQQHNFIESATTMSHVFDHLNLIFGQFPLATAKTWCCLVLGVELQPEVVSEIDFC